MKFFNVLWKVILMTALLAGMVVGWFFLAFTFEGPSAFLWIIAAAAFAAYIFLGIKLSRIGNERPEKTDGFWKKAKQPLLVIIPSIALTILVFAAPTIEDGVEEFITVQRAKAAVRSADEIIRYEQGRNVCGSTIYDTSVNKDSILIDYDSKTVTFLFRRPLDELFQVKLQSGGLSGTQNFQYITTLNSPGKTLTTFYSKETYEHLTSGIVLEMENGTIYSAELDNEFLALDVYPWGYIKTAVEASDIAVPYGGNTFPDNYFEIEKNTLFLDTKTNTVSVAYCAEGNVGCNSYELQKTDKAEDVYLQAEIPLEVGKIIYAYTYRIYDKWDKDRTDGFVLIDENGSIFTDDGIHNSESFWGRWNFYYSEYKCPEEHVDITADGIIKRYD